NVTDIRSKIVKDNLDGKTNFYSEKDKKEEVFVGLQEKYKEAGFSDKEIKELKKLAKEYDVKLEFSPTLIRGLSYYNGSIFEIKTNDKSSEMKETICAGGAYLINGIQSVGISFGLERLSQLAKVDRANQDILIISIGKDKEAIKLAENLRNNGKSCIVMYGKISKALDFANSNNIEKVVFIGDEEAKQKKVKLRDMKTGKEKLVSEKALIE
ncbi:MAG: His/Gly/Thr/Pro-type tRNA ligase C-terminal domain-containing protein, partial [archaeon]